MDLLQVKSEQTINVTVLNVVLFRQITCHFENRVLRCFPRDELITKSISQYRYFAGIGGYLADPEDDTSAHRTSSVRRSNSSFGRDGPVHARRKIGLGTNAV